MNLIDNLADFNAVRTDVTAYNNYRVPLERYRSMLLQMGILTRNSSNHGSKAGPPNAQTPDLNALYNVWSNAANASPPATTVLLSSICQAFIDQGGRIRTTTNTLVNLTSRPNLIRNLVLKDPTPSLLSAATGATPEAYIPTTEDYQAAAREQQFRESVRRFVRETSIGPLTNYKTPEQFIRDLGFGYMLSTP